MPPHTGRIYDCTDPMGIIVRDTSLDIREESIYGLLDGGCLVLRLGRTGGLLLLMRGASPLARLFDVAPDRRFGAVGIA